MKEKIGMEKLIELLNEKEKELSPSIQVEWTEFSVGINKWYLISKECGFIKWLVENDKIDYRWMPKFEERSRGTIGIDVEGENRVLMCLAISKHPIEDLLLYLK